jgi:hypothetical protein
VLYERDGQPAGYAIYRTHTDFTTRHTELLLIELIGQDPSAAAAGCGSKPGRPVRPARRLFWSRNAG